mmetsp:Transcript_70209/g.199061  ORF Transcript_70209/g.199061 Transcript_70209/m.199061 type:complete len:202 (-) Transcript_70209:1442-2047(-)
MFQSSRPVGFCLRPCCSSYTARGLGKFEVRAGTSTLIPASCTLSPSATASVKVFSVTTKGTWSPAATSHLSAGVQGLRAESRRPRHGAKLTRKAGAGRPSPLSQSAGLPEYACTARRRPAWRQLLQRRSDRSCCWWASCPACGVRPMKRSVRERSWRPPRCSHSSNFSTLVSGSHVCSEARTCTSKSRLAAQRLSIGRHAW